jgi:hypothetical protein
MMQAHRRNWLSSEHSDGFPSIAVKSILAPASEKRQFVAIITGGNMHHSVDNRTQSASRSLAIVVLLGAMIHTLVLPQPSVHAQADDSVCGRFEFVPYNPPLPTPAESEMTGGGSLGDTYFVIAEGTDHKEVWEVHPLANAWDSPPFDRYVRIWEPDVTPGDGSSPPMLLGWASYEVVDSCSLPADRTLIDDGRYVADVTIPDGTTFAPNAKFTKTWRVQNSGTTTWSAGYQLAFVSGEHMGGPSSVSLSRTVNPGEQMDLAVDLSAPAKPGTYRSTFQIRNAQGVLFGGKLVVIIKVVAPAATSTPKPTATLPRPAATQVGRPPTPTGALRPGDSAVATDTTRLRVGPSVKWGELQTVGPGTRIRILNGPVVADGYTWYSVSLSNNDSYAGWCDDRSLRRETFDSRQIRFNVKNGIFTRLKIVGQNQYGDTTVWEKQFTTGQAVADTKDFWWRETLTLDFDVLNRGSRQCVIDSLHLTTTDQYQPVTYIEGQGCTGDDGSARSDRKYVEQLDEALSFAEASEITSILEKTNAGLGCLDQIAQGIGSKLKIIKLTVNCGSVAIDQVREILGNNHITLQILKGPVAYSLYCTNQYGANAYAAYKDARDAKSWACFLGSKELGSLDMDAACRLTSQARPKAVMGDRWQALSWYCTP